MVKVTTSVSIDEALKKKAKEGMVEISAATEYGIKHKLNIKEVQIKDVCEFCGKELPKAYIEHSTGRYHDGLTWICPDEKWICDGCLDYKKKNVVTAF